MLATLDPERLKDVRHASVRYLNRRGACLDEGAGIRWPFVPLDDDNANAVADALLELQAESEELEWGHVTRTASMLAELVDAFEVFEGSRDGVAGLVDTCINLPAPSAAAKNIERHRESLEAFSEALKLVPVLVPGLRHGLKFFRALQPTFVHSGISERRRTSLYAVQLADRGVPVRDVAEALGKFDDIESVLAAYEGTPEERELRRKDAEDLRVAAMQKRIEDMRKELRRH